jgi:hypothetical protein
MEKLEFKILQEPQFAAALSSLAASITQHPISDMDELVGAFEAYKRKPASSTVKFCQSAKHNTQRHNSYTIAVVGTSRRLLAQIRTHHVGIDFTSASLQYQDVSATADFFIPYKIYEECEKVHSDYPVIRYKELCMQSADAYNEICADVADNDTAGYVMNNSIRNVLLITGNAEAFRNLINRRTCNRNTVEAKYVAFKIWEALLQTKDGDLMFGSAGPDCVIDKCREGRMFCKHPLTVHVDDDQSTLVYVQEVLSADFKLINRRL